MSETVNTDWAKDIPCRYITLYGFCKNENSGCTYNHNIPAASTTENEKDTSIISGSVPGDMSTSTEASNAAASLGNASPSSGEKPALSQPLSKGVSAINELKKAVSALKMGSVPSIGSSNTIQFDPINSPVFKPTSTASFSPLQAGSKPLETILANPPMFNPYADKFVSSQGDHIDMNSTSLGTTQGARQSVVPPALSGMGHPLQMFSANSSQMPLIPQDPALHQIQSQQHQIGQQFHNLPVMNHMQHGPMSPLGPMSSGSHHQHTNDPSIIFAEQHLYNPDPPPHLKVPLEPHQRTPDRLFISNSLRIDLLDKTRDLMNVPPHNVPGLPSVLHDYFNISFLYALDANNMFYKCISNYDGQVCLIHRKANYSIESAPNGKKIASVYQACSKIKSNSIVELKDLFLTTQFNDRSVCLVYDYHPQSVSLNEFYRITSGKGLGIEEEYVWLYLVQMTTVIKNIHMGKLFCGELLNFDNFLITSIPGRIKFFGLGRNLLSNDSIKLNLMQQGDFTNLGLMLQKMVDLATFKDAALFQEIISYLLNAETSKSMVELTKIFAVKFFDIMENLQTQTEYTEQELSKELENGRLFRLMCKLNSVINRPESVSDINWSENGSKYPLKMFYHYVFHQQDPSGKKTLDLTHVLRCLNKLDAGVPEKVLLVTPDEMNCMLISYKELKTLMDFSFKNIV